MEVLTVTCIKPMKIGFLEIYGHKKPEFLTRLDDEISSYQPHLKKMASQSELHRNLQFDTIYLALSAGKNKYHRCIVREKRSNNKAMIELIDYGSNYEVDTSLVSTSSPLTISSSLVKMPFFSFGKHHLLKFHSNQIKQQTFHFIPNRISFTNQQTNLSQCERKTKRLQYFVSVFIVHDANADKLIMQTFLFYI